MKLTNLPQRRLFIAVTACLAFGRWIVAALIFVVTIGKIVKLDKLVGTTIIRDIALWALVICTFVPFILGSRLKCPECGKNLIFVWNQDTIGCKQFMKLAFLQRVSEVLFPKALRTLEDNCANCGAHFTLKKI
ncbi:MAG TPA: hypothetical protein VNX25_08010 [Verrucomicrobiae bacterium]|nr:hypothetical protein [Verrucomicrobiae bacterium]